ncbi:MAG: hypothetical protein KGJ56_07280 [Gammaproteobacteria bacterium]|nr:hypothetical protein [Gammaproteobacteria bacterium]
MALAWLLTVIACTVEGHALSIETAQAAHLSADPHAAHHQNGDSQDDDCCQWQSHAVGSFTVPKYLNPIMLAVIVPLAFVFVMLAPRTGDAHEMLPLSPEPLRRRLDFLHFSLQAQAPPR